MITCHAKEETRLYNHRKYAGADRIRSNEMELALFIVIFVLVQFKLCEFCAMHVRKMSVTWVTGACNLNMPISIQALSNPKFNIVILDSLLFSS